MAITNFGPGTFVWTDGAPTHNPDNGAKFAIDINTYVQYEWVSGTTWVESPISVKKISGTSAPTGAPGLHDSQLAVNEVPALYYYFSGSWHLVSGGGGGSYTEGEGIDITAGVISLDTLDRVRFNQSPSLAGGERIMRWNDTDGTLEFGMKGGNVTQQIGQELPILVKNADNAGLSNGTVVYVVGSDGTNKTVRLAKADSETTSANTFGVMTESATGGNKAFCTTFGMVHNLDTSALTEGAMIWLSATTAGAMTTTRPTAPNHAVQIGFCIRSHATQGVIFVTVQNGYELGELHNVAITSPAAGNVLAYNSGTGAWVNTPGVLASTTAGGDLSGTFSNLQIVANAVGANEIDFPILAPDGSVAAPSYSFANYPTAGLSMDAATTTLNTPAGTPMLINAEAGSEITIRTADRAEDAIVSPINITTGASTGTGTGGGINITTGGGETGGQLAVTLGSAISGIGGAFAMYGGDATTGTGGGIVFDAGASVDGSGGQVNITSGASTTGPGGAFQLQAGSSTSGLGGYFSQSAGNSTDGEAGYFQMTAGTSITNNGGYFSMQAGEGVTGGNFTMRSGDATGSNAAAGNFNMSAGNNPAGLGGAFSLSSGSGIYGGNVTIQCGASAADEDSGGSFVMQASTNSGTDGEGGQFYIRGGDAPNGIGGNINLEPGQGATKKAIVAVTNQAIFKFGDFTTAQRDALTGTIQGGSVIFNITTQKLQVYAGGAWVDLH